MPDDTELVEQIGRGDQAALRTLLDRDALMAWLPPRGMTARFERFDPRPGGSYRLVLTYADASATSGKATPDSDVVEATARVFDGERAAMDALEDGTMRLNLAQALMSAVDHVARELGVLVDRDRRFQWRWTGRSVRREQLRGRRVPV